MWSSLMLFFRYVLTISTLPQRYMIDTKEKGFLSAHYHTAQTGLRSCLPKANFQEHYNALVPLRHATSLKPMYCHDIIINAVQKLSFEFLTDLEDDMDLANRSLLSLIMQADKDTKNSIPKNMFPQYCRSHNPDTSFQPESVKSTTTTGLQSQQLLKKASPSFIS